MASIGHADLLIVPKFDGLSNAVDKALGGVDMSGSGKAGGTSFSNGFKSGISGGAIVGAVSAVTGKAIDAIASRTSDAVSRLDTLKNYPMVMESLGVSAKEADASMGMMSDRLMKLPTRLDAMVSSVQGIYAATKDYGVSLTTATDAGLALNDMLLAGGQGTQVASAAMEQFRQMLAKGKPEMQDWKALISAAPGQVDQLAKSMLGAGAGARDLYYALGGGKDSDEHMDGIQFASVSMSDLLDAIVRLDKEGGAGLESFASQAEKASGGIETSMANAGNAITRGLADTMDAIGRDRIAGFFNAAKEHINGFFGVVKSVAPGAVDLLSGIASAAANAGPSLVGLGVGLLAVAKLGPMLTSMGITRLPLLMTGLGTAALDAGAGLAAFVGSINPIAAVVGAVGAGVAVAGVKFMELNAAQEKASSSMSSFSDAVSKSTGLDEFAGRIDGIGVSAQAAKLSMDEFYDRIRSHADAMRKNVEEAEAEIASLNVIQDVIGEYAGKAAEGVTVANMSADAHGRLEYALKALADQYGLTLSAEDVLNGSYVDQEGNVVALKDAVDQLCESRRNEARVAALQANMAEAYSAQREAIKQVQDAQDAYMQRYGEYVDAYNNDMYGNIRNSYESAEAYAEMATQVDGTKAVVEQANSALNECNDQVAQLEAEMGSATGKTGELKDALARMADDAGNTLVSELAKSHVNIDALATKLAAAGVSAEKLESVGAASLSSLASACRGDVDKMVRALQELDGVDIAGKSFSVGDDGTITFQSGQLSELDMQQLRDKGFVVTDNGTSVTCKRDVDALGGSVNALPERRDVTVRASVSGISDVWSLYNAITSTAGTHFANIVASISRGATGAFVKGAGLLGGAVRAESLYRAMSSMGGLRPLLHADGGIVDAPTLTSVGFLGEDGAEAIIPLTNRRYVRPFAQVLADEMGWRGGKAAAGDTYNITVHASGDGDEIARSVIRAIRAQDLMKGRR